MSIHFTPKQTLLCLFIILFSSAATAQDPCFALRQELAKLKKEREQLAQKQKTDIACKGVAGKTKCQQALNALDAQIKRIAVRIAKGACSAPESFGFVDISPESTAVIATPDLSEAGLVYQVAGDKNGLYAVTLNAGIWTRKLLPGNLFSPWVQLPGSPRYANCIAVDPNSGDHIAVGEREGDAIDVSTNHTGLWESFDGGKTFAENHFFDAGASLCATTSQTHAVTGVLITQASSTIVATPCGIARRPALGVFSNVLSDDIKAIAQFQDLLVARTADAIYISADDGATWPTHVKIVNSFRIGTTARFDRYILDNQLTTGAGVNYIPEGFFSVAIIRDGLNAFVYIPASPTDGSGNVSLLTYNLNAKTWLAQRGTVNLGTGLGGRVFVKSYFVNQNNLPDGVGGKTNIFVCAAQDIIQAKSIDQDGIIQWSKMAYSGGSGGVTRKFHNDIWDIHLDPNAWFIWVSHDGGISYSILNRTKPDRVIKVDTLTSWLNFNQGLHNQHIHAFAASQFNLNQLNIAYSTSDNGAWYGTIDPKKSPPFKWQVIGGLGDVNFSYQDYFNPFSTFQATSFDAARIQGFPGFFVNTVFNCKHVFEAKHATQQVFQFIQTLPSENTISKLDAVMLVTPPLTFGATPQPVNGDLGKPNPAKKNFLIRNETFNANPNTEVKDLTAWTPLFTDLPDTTQCFWVAGGHADPTFFILRSNNSVKNIGTRKSSDATWTFIPTPASGVIDPGEFGPLFVNPYDPKMVFLVCADGIYRLNAAGNGFDLDERLTDLITGNSKYPIADVFFGGNTGRNNLLGSRANAMCPLSCMAFNPDKPEQIVCSSPFTGLFYKNGNNDWQNLTGLLPKPYTPISCVSISNVAIVVSTEGRGIYLLKRN